LQLVITPFGKHVSKVKSLQSDKFELVCWDTKKYLQISDIPTVTMTDNPIKPSPRKHTVIPILGTGVQILHGYPSSSYRIISWYPGIQCIPCKLAKKAFNATLALYIYPEILRLVDCQSPDSISCILIRYYFNPLLQWQGSFLSGFRLLAIFEFTKGRCRLKTVKSFFLPHSSLILINRYIRSFATNIRIWQISTSKPVPEVFPPDTVATISDDNLHACAQHGYVDSPFFIIVVCPCNLLCRFFQFYSADCFLRHDLSLFWMPSAANSVYPECTAHMIDNRSVNRELRESLYTSDCLAQGRDQRLCTQSPDITWTSVREFVGQFRETQEYGSEAG